MTSPGVLGDGARPFNVLLDRVALKRSFSGNPDLRIEYTDAFEIGLTKTGSMGMLQLSPFYPSTSDVIRVDINTTDTLDNRGDVHFGARQMMFFVVRGKIQGDQGAILLRVVDPFEMMRFRVRTGHAPVLQVTERDPRSRVVFLGYHYNFGRPPRARQVAPEQTGGSRIAFGTL